MGKWGYIEKLKAENGKAKSIKHKAESGKGKKVGRTFEKGVGKDVSVRLL